MFNWQQQLCFLIGISPKSNWLSILTRRSPLPQGLFESLLEEQRQGATDSQVNDWDFSRSKQDIGVIAAAVIRSARRIRDEQERYKLNQISISGRLTHSNLFNFFYFPLPVAYLLHLNVSISISLYFSSSHRVLVACLSSLRRTTKRWT